MSRKKFIHSYRSLGASSQTLILIQRQFAVVDQPDSRYGEFGVVYSRDTIQAHLSIEAKRSTIVIRSNRKIQMTKKKVKLLSKRHRFLTRMK